jgi:hypothetical protein
MPRACAAAIVIIIVVPVTIAAARFLFAVTLATMSLPLLLHEQ